MTQINTDKKSVISYWLLVVSMLSAVLIGCAVDEKSEDRVQKAEDRERSLPSEGKPSETLLTTNIYQLITDLGSEDWETRDKAQEQLENWPTGQLAELEPALKSAAQSSDPEVKMRANRILKILSVRKRLAFSDTFLKKFPNIYYELRDLNTSDKFGLLQRLINDKENRPNITAKDIAGLIGEVLLDDDLLVEASAQAGKGLTIEQKWFLIEVSTGSGWSGKPIPESAPALRKLLKDKDASVRRWAVVALGQLGDQESIPGIRPLLKDKNALVRRSVVSALGDLGDKESIPEIRQLLKDKSVPMRQSAVYALGKLGDKESIPEIRQLLKDEDVSVRYLAVSALGKLGAKESIPEIRKLLKDESAYVRGVSAIALIELGAKDEVPKEVIKDIKLILQWGGDDEKRAAAALKELGVKTEEKDDK